ncbi:MAG: energy transducer TonB [Gemmatimonadaceae bacterium]|nr:energy transducer TonB [Gemmatimonadaceae bacterium]
MIRRAGLLGLALVVGGGAARLPAQDARATTPRCDTEPAAALLRPVPIRVRIGIWGTADSSLVRRVEEAERLLGAAIRERVGSHEDRLADGDTLVPMRDLMTARTTAWIDVGAAEVTWAPGPRASRAQLALLAGTLDRLVAPGGPLSALRAPSWAPLRLGVSLRAGASTDDRFFTAGVPVFTRRLLAADRVRIVDPGPSAVYPEGALREEVEARLLFDVVVDSTGTVDPTSITLVASRLLGITPDERGAAVRARHLRAFAAEGARVIRGRRFAPPIVAGCPIGFGAEQALHFRIQD